MTHYMKLNPKPFSMIAEGRKTIELRLYDEKRQGISLGDTIVFKNNENENEVISCTVKGLHIFPRFDLLYKSLPLDKCGYLPEEIEAASPGDMELYYPEDEQKKYGVVGIELELDNPIVR